MFASSKEKYMEHLNESIFEYGFSKIDNCDCHELTHEDTEILGMFCDVIPVHGDDLKRVLLLGYLEYEKELVRSEVDVIVDQFVRE